MTIQAFDHVAIPVADPERMIDFYGLLGFEVPSIEEWRASKQLLFAAQFGHNKINMHGPKLWQNPKFGLRASGAVPGCGDFCFVWTGGESELIAVLDRAGAPRELGPVERIGGRGGGAAKGQSVYTRDPDLNLLEFIIYPE